MLKPMLSGKKVCVVGAGTMGSGIAAHLANIGFTVSLLDVSYELAQAAFTRAKAARPPHFYLPATANNIKVGSIQEDWQLMADADWICEAIVERLDAKKALFDRVEEVARADALISTNTSGLQLALLTEGRSDAFRKRFLGTHFFNPPRHLKLLELIPTADTDEALIEEAVRFFEGACARRVVLAKDTPGFIANRFGMWSMFFAVRTTEKLGLSIEEVDLLTGPLIGRPRSGSFRLNDLVGIDVMQDIANNLLERCTDDPCVKFLRETSSIPFLLEKGWIGGKAGQGYYKKEGKGFVSLDLVTRAYRERREPEFPKVAAIERQPLHARLRDALELRDEAGEFLREYLLPTLRYADSIKEEISHNVRDFDRVMKWGFGWEAGPFEMIDMIGADKVGVQRNQVFYQATPEGEPKVMGYDGVYFQPKPEPDYRPLASFPCIQTFNTFNARDLGDGVTGIGLTTKMGVISPLAVQELTDFLSSGGPKRIVFSSEAKVFSAGFDLNFFIQKAAENAFDEIEAGIRDFQNLGKLFMQVPSVAAVWGFCLGGGLEMAMSCSIVAASPETQIGLPEAKVGLIPGGGGNVILRQRTQAGGAKALAETVSLLALGTVCTNADEARGPGYLRPTDVTVYHPDRLLSEAKKLALEALPSPAQGWTPAVGPALGMARQGLEDLTKQGELTQHDALIGDKIAQVFAKPTTVEQAYETERALFVELCREGLSLARMKHMLETGKPLRN